MFKKWGFWGEVEKWGKEGENIGKLAKLWLTFPNFGHFYNLHVGWRGQRIGLASFPKSTNRPPSQNLIFVTSLLSKQSFCPLLKYLYFTLCACIVFCLDLYEVHLNQPPVSFFHYWQSFGHGFAQIWFFFFFADFGTLHKVLACNMITKELLHSSQEIYWEHL